MKRTPILSCMKTNTQMAKIRRAIPYRELLDMIEERLDKCRWFARQIRTDRKKLEAIGIYQRFQQIRWRLAQLRYEPVAQQDIADPFNLRARADVKAQPKTGSATRKNLHS